MLIWLNSCYSISNLLLWLSISVLCDIWSSLHVRKSL